MLVIGCRGNTPCLVTSWSFLKAAGAGLASPGRLVLRKKQAGGTGTVPLRMWAWQAAPKHHQDAPGASSTASCAWNLVCKTRTTVPFSLVLLIARTVILYLVLPGPFSVLKSFYSLASEVALFCSCHCYPMMFSRMFQVKHQGTVWKWGWTDLGKQSIVVFHAFSSGALRVVVAKREVPHGGLEAGLSDTEQVHPGPFASTDAFQKQLGLAMEAIGGCPGTRVWAGTTPTVAVTLALSCFHTGTALYCCSRGSLQF